MFSGCIGQRWSSDIQITYCLQAGDSPLFLSPAPRAVHIPAVSCAGNVTLQVAFPVSKRPHCVMVGIPGKSKGCTICRRRKIRCGLEQPHCHRCQHSGRECEGYDRYPVFLNRTPGGPQKRERLKETKPAKATPSTYTMRNPSPVPINASSASPPSTCTVYQHRWSMEALAPRVPLQMPPSVVLRGKLVSLFLDMYLPAGFHLPGPSPMTWLNEALSLKSPDHVLSLSIQALSTTRVGRINGDEALTKQGSLLYIQALRELRNALWDKRLMWRDETLAAARTLGIYEIFESTSNSIEALSSHETGIENLITMRGPDQHRSAIGLAILEDVRYSCMIQSLYNRKASIFGTEIWRTRHWDSNSKSVQQTLYDNGYALAALLEEFDSLRNSDISYPQFEHLMTCLQRYCALDEDFENWYELLLLQYPSPLYWPAPPAMQNGEENDKELFPALAFPTFHIAHLHMTFWALRIILSATITNICNCLPPYLTSNTAPPQPLIPCHSSQADARLELLYKARTVVAQAKERYSHAQCFELASKIMQSVPYCTVDTMGLLGAQKCIFSLRTAMTAFEMAPGPGLERCCEVYSELFTKRKVRFARDLAVNTTINANIPS